MKQPPVVLPLARRKVVAVVGDSNLDVTTLKSHRITGDEATKHSLAEQVRPSFWHLWQVK